MNTTDTKKDDTISRQAVIDVIKAIRRVTGDKNVVKIWEQVKDLPPAESPWIPCSERLPKVGENVLFSVGGMYAAEGCLREDGDWAQFRWTSIQPKNAVDAWQPLPAPYKKEKESMKLTREEALKLHRQMWTEMREELGDCPTHKQRRLFAYRWCLEHPLTSESICDSCYLCEYAKQVYGDGYVYIDCDSCPIDWNGDCMDGKVNRLYSPISEILALPEKVEGKDKE